MKEDEIFEITFIDEDGIQYGQRDYSRWENAKWYQRLLGYFFKPYKNKFLDFKGFNAVFPNGIPNYEKQN